MVGFRVFLEEVQYQVRFPWRFIWRIKGVSGMNSESPGAVGKGTVPCQGLLASAAIVGVKEKGAKCLPCFGPAEVSVVILGGGGGI